jgi:hypothetical protein
MKRLVSVILSFAIVLGVAPVFRHADANAAAGDTFMVTFVSGTIQDAVNGILLTDNITNTATYSTFVLNVSTATSISTANWEYLRKIFDPDYNVSGDDVKGWGGLKTLTINSSSLTQIANVPASNISPLWTEVNLPQSLRTIGDHTFRNSTALESISINRANSVTALAFSGCKNLKSITVAGNNATYNSTGGVLFADGQRTLVAFPPGITGTYTSLPATTTLALNSFTDVSLEALVLLPNVTAITNAFNQTTGNSFDLDRIYFNRSNPPNLTVSNILRTNNVRAYVPATTFSAYETSYRNFFAAGHIIASNHPGAELLGVSLRGYAGVGDFDADRSKEEYGDAAWNHNDQDQINDIDNPFKGSRPYINIETMKISNLPAGFTVTGFSLNGTSWVAGTVAQLEERLLINSAVTNIVLVDDFNTTTRRPAGGHNRITFNRIEARPGGNVHRLRLAYFDDKWGFAASNTATEFSELMDDLFIVLADNNRLPANPNWIKMSGFDNTIGNLPAKGEKRPSYFIYVPARRDGNRYFPSGRPWRVTPATLSREPRYRANYRRESIVLRPGDSFNNGEPFSQRTTVDLGKFGENEIELYGTTVTIARVATGRRPGSMTQELQIATRSSLSPPEITVDNRGRITTDLRNFEFRSVGSDANWGRLPKVSAAAEFEVRRRQTVKITKTDMTGEAASLPCIIRIAWGELENGKNGITGAVISPTASTD